MLYKLPPKTIYFGSWLIAATYALCRDVFYVPWQFLIIEIGSHFFVWSLLGLLVMPMIRTFPLRFHWKSCLFHLGVAFIITQIDVSVAHWLTTYAKGNPKDRSLVEIALRAFESCYQLSFVTYWGFVAVVQWLDAKNLAQINAVQAADHKTAFVKAQLQGLKTQLQPHFLFNTLHSISSLMHYDVASADRLLIRLSELLRIFLQESGSANVSLEQEKAFIEAYLEIEKIRFEERLEVDWVIPEELRSSSIPSFILQPLVENAIKFGIAPHADGGNITIRAYSKNNFLNLEVENKFKNEQSETSLLKKGFGIGLSNTKTRLETLYGDNQHFDLIRTGLTTIARIRVPLINLTPVTP
jgi:two-component system LytT family sensor kinase